MLRNSNQPRIAPIEPPYDPETAAALELLGPPLALFRVFARRPDRARAIHGWGSYYLSRRLALTVRQRELVIDRVTARCGAEYEWGIHLRAFADKAMLTAAQQRSVTIGSPADACWDPADAALLRSVDALLDRRDLTDDEWAELVAATTEDGAIDALLLCGWYQAISYVARATRLPAEPDTPSFAEIGVPGGSWQ
jgi:alkylhydroperoxidase family enzyme